VTQTQINYAVAASTGDSIHTVRQLGFGLLAHEPHDLEPEDLCLVLDCPFCRQPVPYLGTASSGEQAIAECDRCDVYFDFVPGEVYAAVVSESKLLAVEAA
jgi:hypothetical protein